MHCSSLAHSQDHIHGLVCIDAEVRNLCQKPGLKHHVLFYQDLYLSTLNRLYQGAQVSFTGQCLKVTYARYSLSWKQIECEDVISQKSHKPFSNDGLTYLQVEPEKDNPEWSPISSPRVWPWSFFPPLCGQRHSKGGRQEDTQAGFAATGTNTSAAPQQASGAAPGVIWTFLLLFLTCLFH